MSDLISHSATVSFRYLDGGYYEDDPVFSYKGPVGEAYVELTAPKVPGRHNGNVKVTITIEPVEDARHIWIECEDESFNEMCLACGVVAEHDDWNGVKHPDTSCPGEKE
jgi:hypothetical protein